MKKKNLAFIGAAVGTCLLTFACIFAACQLEVAEEEVIKPILTPYISVPPASASYTVNDTASILQAQVWDWNSENGALSYQWYTFDSIASFSAAGAGTAIEGASGTIDPEAAVESAGIKINTITFSPSLSPEPGKKYYFYLEIKNYDPAATGDTEITVRSEIATISFNDVGAARIPLIIRHPASNSYQFGRSLILGELSVRATAPDGGTLSYQWYYNATGSVNPDDLKPIVIPIDPDDPTAASAASKYRPTTDLLVPGNNYFFVEITNTLNGDTAVELSAPAIIYMESGETALEPVILAQPTDKLYFAGEAVQPLTVQAEEPAMDGGIISYQWYSNTIPQSRNGTAIEGAADKTFTPPISEAGTYYYYAVVTNTNPSVKSNVKTTTANSRAIKIVISGGGAAPEVNITVNVLDPRLPQNRYQYVRGYGGMDVAWANFPEQKPEDMETMYNPDWGLGYNMNRIMISPANTNVNVSIRDLINSHRPYYYENVKIVNKYNGYNLASPWSPPKEWKTNNSINGGGRLIYTYRQQFADYLRTFAQHMYDAGAPIYAISISNEPNYTAGYDGCEWEPEEMRDFFVTVNPKPFTRGIRGYGGGRETERVLAMNGESANTPYINILALQNETSRANLDVFARHVYGEQTSTLWKIGLDGNALPSTPNNSTINNILNRNDGVPPANSNDNGTFGTKYEVWMTEHNINSANATAYPNDSTWNYIWRFMNDIDLVMRLNNENAFVWWASKRFYSMLGDGQYNTRDGAALPRGYGLSHYAKYTIDTHRIGIEIDRNALMADGTRVGNLETAQSNINNTAFNLDNNAVRITAYASLTSGSDNRPVKMLKDDGSDADDWRDVNYISMILWAPTATNGSGGRDVGTLELKMPAGFLIGGVSAHRSVSATEMFQPEDNVQISATRDTAFVVLGPGELLSVKFTRQ